MIGDVVGTLSVNGYSAVTYSLVNNPNGSFSISGNNLVQAQDLAPGNYSVAVKAVGAGLLVNQTISLLYLPNGFINLLDADGAYLTDADGAYLLSVGVSVVANLTALYVSQGIY